MEKNMKNNKINHSESWYAAVQVIIIFGVISMLGDMVYETARSANSQYFNILGISATTVGLVFGIGEFLGYGLRLLAGVLSDKSGKQWVFMFVGYGMLIVVPLMGLTYNWNILVVLILFERIGKALRNPAKDTVLSSVAENQVGVGKAFGLQEALDQIGAFLGPLIFTAIFAITQRKGIAEYQLGYKLLIIPYIALMLFLVFAYKKINNNNLIPEMKTREFRKEKLPKVFWVYTLFTFVCTMGFVNFSTTGYHVKAAGIMEDGEITFVYSIAMGVDAITSLIVGRMYDKVKENSGRKSGGLKVMAMIPIITMLLPFFTLSNSRSAVIVGMMIFGIVMGTHETIMRSAISDISPYYKRGTSYGIFNAAYGLALMAGSYFMGLLYDFQMISLIRIVTVALEVLAIIIFVYMMKLVQNKEVSI
jgi:predicted MFS family arabinose efflux permease